MTEASSGRTFTVLSVAGRSVSLYAEGEGVVEAKLSSRALQVIPGDRVSVRAGTELLVNEIVERSNCLLRTFSYQDRQIAANLDLLFLVTAVDRLFNSIAIDRLLSIAHAQSIPVTIILNKIDLAPEPRIEIYRNLGFTVLLTSAKFGQGMTELRQVIESPENRVTVLCGVSGVGKSTILNWLLPEVERRTNEVSTKTGQGRQTTTQSIAYPLPRSEGSPVFLVDLPGVQHFGISHLSREQIRASFPELQRWGVECQYGDCWHIAEPVCAVKDALTSGAIAVSRYESYRNMLEELDQMPAFRKYGKVRGR